MIRTLLAILLAVLSASNAMPAEQGQLDASPTLFSVLAAINAAGYDADLDSPANDPIREAVRKNLASRNIPCLNDLKQFFAAHRQKDWTAELSQYVSFALSVDGPPSFEYRFQHYLLPPDVQPMTGFETLMARFHREADIDTLWQQAQSAFERQIARYHQPVSAAVLEVNGYMRNTSGGFLGRRFQIYIDLLGAPNQIHTRSYADDYFVVLTPSPEPQVEDVRHAYLHYLLDPLATKYGMVLEEKKPLIDFALGAPHLEEYYKNDFLLLTTESLIRAVESRLARGSAEKKNQMVAQALGEGFILTPYFAEQLPAFEQQDQAMRLYFPEMIKAIDLKRESKRLENVQFAATRPVRKAKVVPAERKVEPTGVFKTLEEAEQLYTGRNLDSARAAYLKVLEETDQKPLHAKAYYGLARIAALKNDPELAEKLFQQILELSPDPQTAAWAHVYLGRLSDIAGDREAASGHYQAALRVQGASNAARKAAEQGLKAEFPRNN
ncbi:MAG: tetratricopeptide repeat protein [Bryobacteraceae bacterium]|nr:tetratricopeptide repeat protein [Bryobacteraceae bacterium]